MNPTQRIKHRADITSCTDKVRGILQFETETENLSYMDLVGILEWLKMEIFATCNFDTEDDEE